MRGMWSEGVVLRGLGRQEERSGQSGGSRGAPGTTAPPQQDLHTAQFEECGADCDARERHRRIRERRQAVLLMCADVTLLKALFCVRKIQKRRT